MNQDPDPLTLAQLFIQIRQMPSFLSISADDDAAMQRMDIAAVSSIGGDGASIESKREIEKANSRLKKWHHPCGGVSGVWRGDSEW